jgi:sialate O-acetylesterase
MLSAATSTEWGEPEMPFYFVQIAPHHSQNADIRDAQLATLHAVPRTGMAVITDWGDSADIHPRNKQVVGHRLALWALVHDYGQHHLPYSGPLYTQMQVDKGLATLHFEHAEGLVGASGNALRDFTIAGADSVFVPAQAQVVGHTVVVSSPQVPQPVAVRYGWRPVPHGNLVNAGKQPASAPAGGRSLRLAQFADAQPGERGWAAGLALPHRCVAAAHAGPTLRLGRPQKMSDLSAG